MPLEIRPVLSADYDDVLELWDTAFKPQPTYFVRYFDGSDPWYREGDCLGAWIDGRLASAVHICRRPLEWRGGLAWCGAIANVATHPDFRRQGLSRELLHAATRWMDAQELAFSLLFSSQHAHYEPLGWQRVPVPRVTVTLAPDLAPPGLLYEPLVREADAVVLHAEAPHRPLHLARPLPYWEGWVEWLRMERMPELECITVRSEAWADLLCPANAEQPGRLMEWHALDAATEGAVLRKALLWAGALGKSEVVLEALPQLCGVGALEALGTVSVTTGGYLMLRNGTLSEREFQELVALYHTGAASWSPWDAF